jgi:predicted nuclease of predicted toxin-antitoxin system
MRFLLDANMPRSAIGTLSARGHHVEFARDIGLGAAPDTQIAERARQTGNALLTRDLDFADIRQYPPGQYGGIVVLRLPDAIRDCPRTARSVASAATPCSRRCDANSCRQ